MEYDGMIVTNWNYGIEWACLKHYWVSGMVGLLLMLIERINHGILEGDRQYALEDFFAKIL